MKEVLSKNFWKDVKKTFQQALDGAPPADGSEQTAPPKQETPNTESATAHPSEG